MSGPTGRKLTRPRVVSLMCYLMSHECTVRQLARFMGMSRTCAGDWIRELHKNGKHKCVHITGYSKTLRGGYRAAIYAWGEGTDAPKPPPMTSAQRAAKCRDKSTIDLAWKMPSTRARDAAVARTRKESKL